MNRFDDVVKHQFFSQSDSNRFESRLGRGGKRTEAPAQSEIESRLQQTAENTKIPPQSYRLDREREIKAKFFKEFCQGSGISPDLYQVALEGLPEQRVNEMGDVEIPLFEALGFHYVRFGQQVKQHPDGIGFKNEDGSFWQAKLDIPKVQLAGKNKPYYAPKGNGSRAYLPPVDPDTRRKIGERLGKEVPESGLFWDWVEQSNVSIILTEGGKKGLSALSHGFVSIALYGCNSGYRKLDNGAYELIGDLKRFAAKGRRFRIALDQDSEPKTRKRVNRATWRLATVLEKEGCQVEIIEWNPCQGKGIDDVIVQSGIETFERAVDNAVPFSWWKIRDRVARRFSKKPDVLLDVQNLAGIYPRLQLPERGVICIKSAKKTYKTELLRIALADSMDVVSLTHRRALGRNLSDRLELTWIENADSMGGRLFEEDDFVRRISLCVDSLRRTEIAELVEKTEEFDLILDEAAQVANHLLVSQTTGKDGIRPLLLAAFEKVVRKARRIFLADADLDNATIDWIMEIRNQEKEGDAREKPYTIHNIYQPAGEKRGHFVADEATALGELTEAALRGERIFIACDTLTRSKKLWQKLTDLGKYGLLINSETTGRPEAQEYIADPANVQWQYDFICASPSLATGVSVSGDWCDRVFGFFSGWSLNPSDAAQFLSRIRNNAPATIWAVKQGRSFSKVSRHCDPIQFLGELKLRSDLKAKLVKTQLSTDALEDILGIDYQNPHYRLYAEIESSRNWQQWDFRATLQVLLSEEGWSIEDETDEKADAVRNLLLRETNLRRKELRAESIPNARKLNLDEALEIEALKEVGAASDDQLAALERHKIKEFYKPFPFTRELLEIDNEGRLRGQITNAKYFHDRELNLAEDLTAESIEGQFGIKHYVTTNLKTIYTAWDFSTAKEQKEVRILLGLDKFFEEGLEWHKDHLYVIELAQRARECSAQIQQILNITINPKMTDVQVVNQLLEQLGYKFDCSRPIRDGKRVRVYSLNAERRQFIEAVIDSQIKRWHTPPEEMQGEDYSSVHPPCSSSYNHSEGGGGQETEPPREIDLEGWTWNDIWGIIHDAKAYIDDEPSLELLLEGVPKDTHSFIRNNLIEIE